MSTLEQTAKQLVADHKGLLAADESIETAGRRLASIGLESTEETRRQYRNIFFTAPGVEEGLSGVIMFEETMKQSADDGTPFVEILQQKGIIPGIKVDAGTKDLEGFPGEKITEGLDTLPDRLKGFFEAGARFAKWRSVITIGDGIPTDFCIEANARIMARYAALAQEAGIVPIVEPEVLINGDHNLATSEAVTTRVLRATFEQLHAHHVDVTGIILKSSMAISGNACVIQATPEEIAEATIRMFETTVPHEVPGIVFLSGGQGAVQATVNLNAINKASRGSWKISFSYARALQGPSLEIWKGKPENVPAAQKEFLKRLRANVKANAGTYSSEDET
ncbi:MAG: class I fructose-bisphosphate aldolase [Patescibacteria group bacterium]